MLKPVLPRSQFARSSTADRRLFAIMTQSSDNCICNRLPHYIAPLCELHVAQSVVRTLCRPAKFGNSKHMSRLSKSNCSAPYIFCASIQEACGRRCLAKRELSGWLHLTPHCHKCSTRSKGDGGGEAHMAGAPQPVARVRGREEDAAADRDHVLTHDRRVALRGCAWSTGPTIAAAESCAFNVRQLCSAWRPQDKASGVAV